MRFRSQIFMWQDMEVLKILRKRLFNRHCLRVWLITGVVLFSCCKSNVPDKSPGELSEDQRKQSVRIHFITPRSGSHLVENESVDFHVEVNDSLSSYDTLVMTLADHILGRQPANRFSGTIKLIHVPVGNQLIRAEIHRSGKRVGSGGVSVVIYPAKAPEKLGYRIVYIYNHDPTAYTQGLVFDQGIIYESTGLRGHSTLRKWIPETGEIVAALKLPPDLFGEGCALLGDELYQLTWTSRQGFVYDKKTLNVKKKFRYSTQGWGLTSDGKQLIMSDGTQFLYFLNPGFFTVTGRVEVYDDEGPVTQLNELEYINGLVWANVYMTDEIVVIDPGTGKVVSRLDCTGLLSKVDRKPDTDVLNGIAWDAARERLFVTGKNWPKLFVIQPVPQR